MIMKTIPDSYTTAQQELVSHSHMYIHACIHEKLHLFDKYFRLKTKNLLDKDILGSHKEVS